MNATASPQEKRSLVDRVFFLFFIASMIFLVFGGGMLFGMYSVSGNRFMQKMEQAVVAVKAEQKLKNEEIPSDLYEPVPHQKSGVTILEEEANSGYFAYSSAHEQGVRLINPRGELVHHWKVSFKDLFPGSGIPEDRAYIRRFSVHPNGDLICTFETPVRTPFGLGAAKLNAKSEVIWTLEMPFHHDLSEDEEGNIYLLSNRVNTKGWEQAKHVLPPVLEEDVVILSPEGKVQKSISLVEALAGSPQFAHILETFPPEPPQGDLMHNNTVHLVGPEFASHYEGVSAGDLMLYLRDTQTTLILNPQTEQIVWARKGLHWYYAHDPWPLPNGNILIFANSQRRDFTEGHGPYSASIEFDPRSERVIWMYKGTADLPMYSWVRACQHLLPDRSVLITDSASGRMLHVTRGGQVVWDFYNPVRPEADPTRIAVVFGGRRYFDEQLPFLTSR